MLGSQISLKKKSKEVGGDEEAFKNSTVQRFNCDKVEADILLLEMKTRNGMSDIGFNDVLSLLQKFVPSSNELLENTYEAKQMIYPLGLVTP